MMSLEEDTYYVSSDGSKNYMIMKGIYPAGHEDIINSSVYTYKIAFSGVFPNDLSKILIGDLVIEVE